MRPITSATASEAGRGEAAIALAGSTYCTPAFTSTYNTPTVATPAISAIGIFRSGRFTSPATMFRSFHPSYAHSAATSAAMKPAIPPLAPVNVVAKLRPAASGRVSGSAEADHHDAQNDRHFQHREHKLKLTGLLDSKVVQEQK